MDDIQLVLKKTCEAIEDKKGGEITILDVSRISTFTDFFVICQGQSTRQNQAICDAIKETLRNEMLQTPAHVEGYELAEWILVDYMDFVIHIFSPQSRQIYKLENLWSDGILVEPDSFTA